MRTAHRYPIGGKAQLGVSANASGRRTAYFGNIVVAAMRFSITTVATTGLLRASGDRPFTKPLIKTIAFGLVLT